MAGLIDKIFDKTIPGLSKALDLGWKRNEAIASNIANAETPQYRAIDMDFAGELNKAFQDQTSNIMKTNAQHMDIGSVDGTSHYIKDLSGATKPDGHNVDIDLQMGRLAYNSGKYTMAASIMRKKLQLIKVAIREAGR